MIESKLNVKAISFLIYKFSIFHFFSIYKFI